MAHGDTIRATLRNLYVNGLQDLKAAAEQSGVSYGTARNWKQKAKLKGDCWDTARNSILLSQEGDIDLINEVVKQFFVQSKTIFQQVEQDKKLNPMQKVDLLAKWSDSLSKVQKNLGVDSNFDKVGNALEVIKLLSNFIIEQFPQYKEVFSEVLEPFGEELVRQYG